MKEHERVHAILNEMGACSRRHLRLERLDFVRLVHQLGRWARTVNRDTLTSSKSEAKTLRRNIRGVNREGSVEGERTDRVPDQNRRVKGAMCMYQGIRESVDRLIRGATGRSDMMRSRDYYPSPLSFTRAYYFLPDTV